MTQSNIGFPRFDLLADDPDKVFRASLTSGDAAEDGGLGGGTLNGTGHLFSPAGIEPVDGSGTVKYAVSSGDAITMRDTMCLSLEVDKDWVDSTVLPTNHSYLFSKGNGWLEKRTSGEFRFSLDSGSLDLLNCLIRPDDKPDIVPLLIMADDTDVYFFVDGLLCMKVPRVRLAASTYEDWYLAGLTTVVNGATEYFINHTIRNAAALKRLQTFPTGTIKSVGFLGDSFYANTGIDGFFNDSDNDIFWFPGNGYNSSNVLIPTGSSGTTSENRNGANDTAAICQIFRKLSQAGHWPDNNVNRARSGSVAANTTTQFADMLTDLSGVVPELVFVNTGTNDAVGTPTAAATVDTNFKDLLVDLEQAGVSYVVFQEQLSLSNDPAEDDADTRQSIDDTNATINSLPAYAASLGMRIKVGVSSEFSEFGGHSPDPSLFVTPDNIHPNAIGSSKMGVSGGLAALELIAGDVDSTGIMRPVMASGY